MLEKELHSLIDRRIESLGYRVVSMKYINQANLLQIMIDFQNPGEFIGTRDCVRVSKEISSMLKVEEVISRDCSVEVSSPGLDRPLVILEDFKRYKGHKIKLAMKTIVNGVKKCNAVILDTIDSFIVFGLYNEQKLTVELKDIETAKLSLDDMQLFKTKK